nr:hypothetical protein [uncultured Albidiferax sp.]
MNTTTSEETGAGALASAPLTIDTSNLKDWLLWVTEAATAMQVVYDTYKKVKPFSKRDALFNAYWTCRQDWVRKVDCIKERGGLLLIGGAA